MPYAVTLGLAPDSVAPVHDLVARLAAQGLVDLTQRPICWPHITLAAYPDDADRVALRAAAVHVSAQWKKLTVRVSALGVFVGPPSVLWLAPLVTSALLVRHAQLIARQPVGGVYASGAWVPHVTLSQELSEPTALGAAVATVAAAFAPFDAVLDRVELVHIAPAELIFSGPLASA